MIPKSHSVSRSIVIPRDPKAVYDVVRDFERAPRWRSDVKRVEMLSATRFREDGKVTYEVVNDDPGRQLVTRIVDENLGYSGSWTYTFEPVAGGTRVTITENGEITNLFFRVMTRFVFGYTSRIEKTLSALESAHADK